MIQPPITSTANMGEMGNKYTISKKKTDALYNLVHEDIMQARIKIKGLLKDSIQERLIEEILCNLCYDCPQNAINSFLKQQR